MLDQLRRDIQTRLDELLGEVDKLRHALAALSSRGSTTASRAGTAPRARAAAAPQIPTGPAPATRKASRSSSPRAAQAVAPAPPATQRVAKSPGTTKAATTRAASGSTKAAVLAALAGGDALTAAQIATATGLGRPTVSTTLSRLAKSGEVAKAARGYRLPPSVPAGAAGSAE